MAIALPLLFLIACQRSETKPAGSSNPDGQQLPWTRGFAQDPNNVSPATPNLGDMQMVVNWKDMGFIVQREGPAGVQFLEVERNDAAVNAYVPPLQS